MTLKIDDILKMKGHKNNLGIDAYDFFFLNLENNWISKVDGTKRNATILEGYDEEAQNYILVQLFYIQKEATKDLMLELGVREPYISKENEQHLIDYV